MPHGVVVRLNSRWDILACGGGREFSKLLLGFFLPILSFFYPLSRDNFDRRVHWQHILAKHFYLTHGGPTTILSTSNKSLLRDQIASTLFFPNFIYKNPISGEVFLEAVFEQPVGSDWWGAPVYISRLVVREVGKDFYELVSFFPASSG